MGSKVLIDTNIAIGYMANRFNEFMMNRMDDLINNEYHFSVINKIELLGYPALDKKEEEKFKLLCDHAILHPIDNKIIEKTITIRKKYKVKLPDAIIAATCIENGLKILTLNKKDFENIEELEMVDFDYK